MTWMTTKFVLKKAWVWCKHHWKIIAISFWTLVIYIVARGNVRNYQKVLDQTIENYKIERDALDEIHQEELQKRDEAAKRYNHALESLEKSYKESQQMLSFRKRARFTELMEAYAEDPQNVNELLEKEFGFKYDE